MVETIVKQLQTILGWHHYYVSDVHRWIHDNMVISSNSSKTLLHVFGISLGETLLKSMWHIKAVGQNSSEV